MSTLYNTLSTLLPFVHAHYFTKKCWGLFKDGCQLATKYGEDVGTLICTHHCFHEIITIHIYVYTRVHTHTGHTQLYIHSTHFCESFSWLTRVQMCVRVFVRNTETLGFFFSLLVMKFATKKPARTATHK